MKVMTLKLKPKMIFGAILVITGVLVVLITFLSTHVEESRAASKAVSASTQEEREAFLLSMGWEFSENQTEKELTIPEEWNDVYEEYNNVQLSQGYDLTEYKGRTVILYTYEITNYNNGQEGIVADLLVCDGILIGGDICNISADDGFLTGFEGQI